MESIIIMCTPQELEYLKGINASDTFKNSPMVFALCQYGLFVKYDMMSELYILTDFARALKENSLNFNEGVGLRKRITCYDDMKVVDNSLRLEEIPGGDGIARFG